MILVNETRERIKQEAQGEAATMIQQIKAAQKDVKAIIEALSKHLVTEMQIMRDRFLPSLENLSAEIAEGGATIKKEQATLKVVEEELKALAPYAPTSDVKGNGHRESLELEKNLKSEFATMAVASGQAGEKTIPFDFADKSAASLSSSEAVALFEGEIEIAILPPVDMAQFIQVRRNLLHTQHLKILRTASSWNQGTVINVFADKPLPLVSMLMEMPAVKRVELWAGREEADGDFPWDLALEPKPDSYQRKRVLVTLEKEPGPSKSSISS